MEKSNNAHNTVSKILEGIQSDWDNLKKARYITLELCKIYKYNPVYNYGNSDAKDEIFNRSFMNKMNFESSQNVDYLNFEELNKICVELENIYSYFLTLADVKHSTIGSDTVIFFENNEDSKESFIQSIVKDLHTVKTKKRPIGIVGSSQENILKRIEEIDKEFGYIDERGYIGEKLDDISENIEENDEINVEKFLNNASQYINKVLNAKISDVELHQYYKYLIKTILPHKHIFIIPFSKGDNYKNIQYLIANNSDNERNKKECFLYSEEEGKFIRLCPDNIEKLDGRVVGKQAEQEKGEISLKQYLAKIFDEER